MIKRIITVVTILLYTSYLFSQAGILDPSFADGGILEWDVSESFDRGQAIAVQSDGKIVVALNGGFPDSDGSDIGVVRINEDGTPDTTFGAEGVYYYSNPLGFDAATDIKTLDDGKILVSGWLGLGGAFSSFVVIKLNADGTPDTSFGSEGALSWSTDEDGGADHANCLGVTEDGKILVGGNTRLISFPYASNILWRLNPDGMIDSTFGTNGAFIWNPDDSPKETQNLEIALDGGILTSGKSKPSGADRLALYKVKQDGSGLDSTFAVNGEALGAFEGTAYGLAVHPNGNILISGQSLHSNGMDLIILAYNQDGTPNLSFGFDGVFLIDEGVFDDSYGMAVQQDGKIIAAGSTGGPIFSGGTPSFFSVRIDENGMLDPSWGNDGKVITGGAQDYSFANDIAIQSNGKVLLTGLVDNSGANLRVVRYGNFIDQDEDGFGLEEDCNDLDMAINPDATEIPNNDIDEDCDGIALIIDEDMDGFDSDKDCDDQNAAVNPGAVEVPYNGLDDDCDETTPDDDLDGDGFLLIDDCDDTNAYINPDAEEIPNNEIDEDCDGMDLAVSTEETLLARSISIFPSPARNQITVQVTGQNIHMKEIRILDVSGRTLKVFENCGDEKIQVFNIEALPAGMLFVRIRTDNGTAVKRLLKQ